MIFNKFLSSIIIICCIFFVIGLIPNTAIKESITTWSYFLLFLIPLFLFIVVSRFNKINDLVGKRLSFIGIFSFIATPFLPMLLMFIFWNSSASLDGKLSLVILGILPTIGMILSIYVSLRLWKSKRLESNINPIEALNRE